MDQQTGKYILIIGIIIVIMGILVYFFHDYLKWMGWLPGDFRIERKDFRFYFPLATMIIISVFVTIIINIFKRFF